MRLELPEKKMYTFFILGVPRSGTTIVSRLFDSCENVACATEPHWRTRNANIAYDFYQRIDELGPDYYKQVRSLPIAIGYKETLRPGDAAGYRLLKEHKSKADFIIIVLRDPVLVHSSQRSLGWKEWDAPFYYKESYWFLHALAGQEPNISVVVYEDFIKSPLPYLNSRLPFPITGDLKIEAAHPNDEKWGDPFANRSTEIIPSQREISISDSEISEHEFARKIWNSYRLP